MDQSKTLTVQNSQASIPFNDMERMAAAIHKSGLFGMKTHEQALALMLIAQAEGTHPALAAKEYHVIQGRPALKADAMLARFQAAGGKIVWNAYTDQSVSGTFSHPQGGSATVEWTLQQAKTAGLTGKDVWRQYPRAMLRARVISEGIRTVYPGVSVGVYTPEELADFDAKPATQEVEAVQIQEPELKPAAQKEGKIPSVKLPTSSAEIHAELLPKAVPLPKPKDPEVIAQFDRKAAFARLVKLWDRADLQVYSSFAFKKPSAKDLTDEELKLLLAVASSTPFVEAIKEVAPDYETDVPN